MLAQDVVMEAPPGMDNGAAPMTQYGEGSFFSQNLGTPFRLGYRTESYGQPGRGNFTVGTMPVWSFDGSAAFFDGQVTLNELQGVGYNLGLGYRWLHESAMSDAGRMAGVSLWTDGTSTDEGNFFPQIGLSLESLGDMWDFRSNGYLPLGPQDQQGDFVSTGEIGFQGNSISELTQAVLNTSYAVAEVEAARRLGSERDAWAFAGPYFVGNDDDDAVGYRVGVRGYAYPDLLLQVAVSDDEIFKTNATFSVTWFVGRTRTDFQPTCGVPDRLREPVLRNDYVALSQSFITGGVPLTQPDGSALRIVHVDSDAADGGDGTFENPYNNLTDVNGAGSLEEDIILAHALSVFNGEGTVMLKDAQRLLGEGNGIEHTVATQQEGTIVIPETFAGARNAGRPQLLGPAPGGNAIELADANEVNNFTIDGQNVTNTAIASPAAGSGNPVLRNLSIVNTIDDGIRLTPLTITDTDDVDNDNNVTETIVRGNVTIDDVIFNNIGGDDIDINAFTATNIAAPNTTLQEVINITDITSINNRGRSIAIANTHSGAGRTATVNNFTYNGGATSLGGIVLTNFDSTFNATNSTLTGGNIAGAGAQILGDSDGTMTFASTVLFNDVGGIAVDINGDDAGTDALGGTVTVNGAITNTAARSVRVQNVGANANIDFNGNITDSGDGILVNSNSGGTITFATGTIDLDIDTPGIDAIAITDNAGATIEFTGPVDIDITGNADGLVATGGGTLRYSNTANSITTQTGQVVRIENMTIETNNGVVISDVNRTAAAATAAVELEDNTGGPIVLGNISDAAPGDSGTLVGGAADTVVINDSANVTMSNIIVNNAAGFSGIHIEKTTNTGATAQIVNLNDLIINDGDRGIEVSGAAAASALTLTVSDTQINDSTAIGLSYTNVDSGTQTFNNVDIDGNNVNGTNRGVVISDSNATFNFNAASSIREFGGDDFEVTLGTPNITFNGSIINATVDNPADTTGRSVNIHDVTGGSVTFTAQSSIKDDNLGLLVEDNSGGTFSFLGTNDFDTAANDAVTVQNNTGNVDVVFNNLDINTTSGDGVVIAGNASTVSVNINGVDVTTTAGGTAFSATGGGDLTVGGANNVISTTTGTGVNIDGMNIVTGATFESVTVNGATNGIVLSDVTGAQITIGESGGAQNSGGTLTTTGDAIVLENVANVDLLHVRVASAGGQGVNIDHTAGATNAMDVTINDLNLDASTGDGIDVLGANDSNIFNLRLLSSDLEENVDINITGGGTFGLLVDNNDIDVLGTTTAFNLALSGSADEANITFRNGNDFTAVDAAALSISTTGGTSKTVTMLVEDSSFSNTSATAAADFVANGNALWNATIQGNTFDNAGAGEDFEMESVAAQSRIRLNLGGDAAADFNTAAGSGDFVLTETAGDFDVFERDDTFNNLRNNGNVVPLPNAAAFDDSPVAPPLPPVP
jgi:hypothetical protein